MEAAVTDWYDTTRKAFASREDAQAYLETGVPFLFEMCRAAMSRAVSAGELELLSDIVLHDAKLVELQDWPRDIYSGPYCVDVTSKALVRQLTPNGKARQEA